jgi:hypothetical protein
MPLQIPDEQIPAIVKIRRLSNTSVRELIAALKSAAIEPDSEKMAAQIADRVPGIQIEDLAAIVDVIYELYFVREFANVSQSRFLEDLIQGLRDTAKPDLELKEAEVPSIEDRFKRLLTIDTLNAVAKSARLQRDGERLYCTAKILSDLRPVFTSNAMSRPVGAVITHTLKLDYHKGADIKEFFIVLDSEDLGKLKEVVERAHAKDKTLRGLLKNMKLPDLGV